MPVMDTPHRSGSGVSAMLKFLRDSGHVERLFLAGTGALMLAMVASIFRAPQPVILALGFASAGLMAVGYGLGLFEEFARPNN